MNFYPENWGGGCYLNNFSTDENGSNFYHQSKIKLWGLHIYTLQRGLLLKIFWFRKFVLKMGEGLLFRWFFKIEIFSLKWGGCCLVRGCYKARQCIKKFSILKTWNWLEKNKKILQWLMCKLPQRTLNLIWKLGNWISYMSATSVYSVSQKITDGSTSENTSAQEDFECEVRRKGCKRLKPRRRMTPSTVSLKPPTIIKTPSTLSNIPALERA